jgi:hypothetical protein
MSDVATQATRAADGSANPRAQRLAERLEQGALSLATFAGSLTETEWQTRVPHDGRKIGVMVHHVASMYPIEIHLAQLVASGEPVAGVTWDAVAEINAKHAVEHDRTTKGEALALLKQNSDEAAAAIRALTDAQLDRSNSVSLNAEAPLTTQFVLEDHAVRHSYHHLQKIRQTLKRA